MFDTVMRSVSALGGSRVQFYPTTDLSGATAKTPADFPVGLRTVGLVMPLVGGDQALRSAFDVVVNDEGKLFGTRRPADPVPVTIAYAWRCQIEVDELGVVLRTQLLDGTHGTYRVLPGQDMFVFLREDFPAQGEVDEAVACYSPSCLQTP